MNVLDENVPDEQRHVLRGWRVPIRHIGRDVGWKGMKDHEIIPFLLRSRRPTLFTRDADFYRRTLCHARYCLVVMAVNELDAAMYVRRFLRHPRFRTQAQRLGTVVRLSQTGLTVWRLHAERELHSSWSD